MYATKVMNKSEIELVRRISPYAGALGHTVVGYRSDGSTSIESDSEIRAVQGADVVFIRRRMPSGKYIYRRVVERP